VSNVKFVITYHYKMFYACLIEPLTHCIIDRLLCEDEVFRRECRDWIVSVAEQLFYSQ